MQESQRQEHPACESGYFAQPPDILGQNIGVATDLLGGMMRVLVLVL